MFHTYSYTKLINKNEFIVLIEEDTSFEQLDEILILCKFPYQLHIIENIYEFTINKKYFDLVDNIIRTCKLNVLQIKQ